MRSIDIVLLALVAGCGAAPPPAPVKRVPAWTVIDAKGVFTFASPLRVTELRSRGIDSLVGRYKVGECDFRFDHGDHSNSLTPWALSWPADYRHRATTLSGMRARWATWSRKQNSEREPYAVAVHLPYLTVFADCPRAGLLGQMIAVLETIQMTKLLPADDREIPPHGGAQWAAANGCSIDRAASGKLTIHVTEDGRPAADAFVTAVAEGWPEDGSEMLSGGTNALGIVELDGAIDAKYKIVISQSLTTVVDGHETLHAGMTASGAVCRGVGPGDRGRVSLGRY
ncbi:MAG: hypothetical protein H0V17_28960 [Deltaproteobacteria bacterium]|nr:hypothetical protein [Deltaproteobacteria bacterium]